LTKYSDGWQAHKDRGVLLERIEELEAELHKNQQSWQEHDQGRIFAAKEMQLRIAELEAKNESLEERYSLAQQEIVRLKNDISLLAPAWTKEENWSDE
jgi:uncharacterized small protein (DUF1192 family)